MYLDLIIVVKVGKRIEEIIQYVVLKQGYNMAPVSSLFLVTAFSESPECIWEENVLKK